MRELKFRTWNWLENRYDEQPCAFITTSGELTPSVNRIIEQYTGLKDKNGEEIYEGDILQIDDHILGDFVVVWHGLGWKIKRSVGYETLSVHKSEDCTVIGNIHENPELLEEEECSD